MADMIANYTIGELVIKKVKFDVWKLKNDTFLEPSFCTKYFFTYRFLGIGRKGYLLV